MIYDMTHSVFHRLLLQLAEWAVVAMTTNEDKIAILEALGLNCLSLDMNGVEPDMHTSYSSMEHVSK